MREETSFSQLSLKSFLTHGHVQKLTQSINKNALKQEKHMPPSPEQRKFSCYKIVEESHYMQAFQFQTCFLYIFARNKLNTSELVLLMVEKSDGTQLRTVIKEISSSISCLKLQLCLSESNHTKNNNDQFKILMGCTDGYLKMLYLEKPYFFDQVKLDHKAIVSIQQGNYQLFNNHNVCMVLTSDSQVHFVDIDDSQVVYILRPQILMSDMALSLSIHPLQTHLLQTTEGGYLIFWQLESIIERIRLRREKKTIGRVFDLFPMCIEHSCAIDGLIWATFYGNTIIVLTRSGQFKIIAYIFGNEMQHIQLASQTVQHPQYITYAKLFTENGLILLSSNYRSPHLQQYLLTSQFKLQHVRNIKIEGIEEIRDFYLTSQFNIMLCRNEKHFVMNQCPDYLRKEKKGTKSKREED